MNAKSIPLSQWSQSDQPREKLMQLGAEHLSNAELLAILLRTGRTGENVIELSQRILSSVNNDLSLLGNLSVEQILRDFKGVGPAKAVTMVAALELGRRRKEEARKEKVCLNSSKALFDTFAPFIDYLDHEEMWVTFLNKGLFPIETRRLTSGGLSGTVLDIKQTLRLALERSAAAIALAHNHPSGNLMPSNDDILITEKIKKACDTLEIKLIDHIIVSKGRYYSFFDEGRL
ncbi:MAG: DNA repair protein RadC [Bacteroidales bacterium]|nr:DNA repair protein RadC [Bacteroidales bacterium]